MTICVDVKRSDFIYLLKQYIHQTNWVGRLDREESFALEKTGKFVFVTCISVEF